HAHEAADLRFVFDEKGDGSRFAHADFNAAVSPPSVSGRVGNTGGVPSGSVKMNDAPPSGKFAAWILPSCASTIARQIASPRPTPGLADSRSPRVNFSKIASSLPEGMPGPLSRTSMRIAS